MGRKSRICLYLLLILTAVLITAVPALGDAQPQNAGNLTYVIPIEGDINNINWLFIERAYEEALLAKADAIIFEIDTFGGYVDTAIKIKNLILLSPIPTYTFVNSKAISAGALIALAGEELVMTPGATIGAAEPRLLGEAVDEKTLSMWVGELSGVAEARGRDGQIAAAMADASVVVEGLSEAGKLVTLTANQALAHEMCDEILDSRAALINHYDLSNYVVVAERSFQESAGGWLSDPIVSTILLIIGIAGIVIELVTAGSFGVFGAAGLVGFALYFMGHFWAGNIGMGAIILFAVGIVLIMLEIFVIPGFGVPGILGILAVLASLLFASPTIGQGILTLVIALAVAILLIIITIKNKKTRRVWSKMILFQKLDKESGYSSADESLLQYHGKRGHAITPLRPAGTAEIEGKRLDVVTEGDFINAGSMVEVTLVEGTRVVVREV